MAPAAIGRQRASGSYCGERGEAEADAQGDDPELSATAQAPILRRRVEVRLTCCVLATPGRTARSRRRWVNYGPKLHLGVEPALGLIGDV